MKSAEYNKLKTLVEEHLLDFVPKIDDKSKTLYEAMKYSLVAGGKRIRPVLLLAGLQLNHENVEFGLPFACAIEYIQTYSLIHDDLPAMDNDDYRRGKLTNHKVFGEDMAILAGDGLLSAAYEVMTKSMLMYLDDEDKLKRMVRACYAISKGTGCRGMVAGQVADVENEGKEVSEDMVDFIHENKTAAFITASVRAGGYLGNCDKQMEEDLFTYGHNLGLAFQVVDDILDQISTLEEMGKRVGKDADMGKNTYITKHGLDESKAVALNYIQKARAAMEKYYDEAEVFNDILDTLQSQIK